MSVVLGKSPQSESYPSRTGVPIGTGAASRQTTLLKSEYILATKTCPFLSAVRILSYRRPCESMKNQVAGRRGVVDNGAMNTQSDNTHARVSGRPGENVRAMALVRALWPLFVALFVLGWLVRAASPWPALSRPILVILFLLLAGGCTAFVAVSRTTLSAFIKGAAGEERVAQALAFLPGGWDVFHGVPPTRRTPWPARFDLDHVVLGPSGVFVIETKNWTGSIQIQDNAILYQGRPPSRPPLDQVRHSARELAARIEGVCGARVAVHPILCFAGTPPESGDEQGVGGVIVCSVAVLNRVLNDWNDDPVSGSNLQKIRTWLQGQMG